MLNEIGVTYRQNVQIGRFNADFLCGDLIIECYGDFWHCNPVLWSADAVNRSLKMAAGEKWKKDAARRQKLEAQGIRFHVFWESEILGDPATVRGTLRRLLGDRNELSQAESEDHRLR